MIRRFNDTLFKDGGCCCYHNWIPDKINLNRGKFQVSNLLFNETIETPTVGQYTVVSKS